jgi:benzoate membrane transport protein
MLKDLSFSTFIAGFIAVLVGFSSSAAMVLQATSVLGANTTETGSWLLAVGLSTAVTTIGLSLYYRIPILTSWSTPGAALLISSLVGVSLPEAVGAFIITASLVLIAGLTGWFEKAVHKIPKTLTSAMLAGILMHFAMNIFSALQNQTTVVCMMFITYLLGKHFFPRYAILLVLLGGIGMASYEHLMHFEHFHLAFSQPIFTFPVFTGSAILNVSIPLFIVTMTSQNIPGVAVMRAAGYNPPVSTIISWTGFVNLFAAPFGGFSLCLAAITSTICNSEEADINPDKRYMAAVSAGFFYLIQGLFGATLVALFTAMPKELLLATGALALLSSIGTNLKQAMELEHHREAALITFLISTSGINFFGIGAAFMGLLIGGLTLFIFNSPRLLSPKEKIANYQVMK